MSEFAAASSWYLEGLIGEPPAICRVPVNSWPFTIGRRRGTGLCLQSASVSKEHAEITLKNGTPTLRDSGSRNGTFVNGNRVERPVSLKKEDVLHFANVEFRLGYQFGEDAGATLQVDKSQWMLSLSEFDKLFDPGGVLAYFQPIVALPDEQTHGYEVLGRGRVKGLEHPKQMFEVAEGLKKAADLSRMFRSLGVTIGGKILGETNLFLNTHPAELGSPELLTSLHKLREEAPNADITLEIHEAAITDLPNMRSLRAALAELNMRLAYDDFGAGQARLVDLIEIPPDYLKFDMCLVRDLHLASDARRQTLETLVRMAHDLGVAVLAEGIESPAEAEACCQLGFDFAQGFLYGRPAEARDYIDATATR